MTVWHKTRDGRWNCYFCATWGHKSTRPHEWLSNAEEMMAGRGRENVLWRKNEDVARRLVWC